jgi:hypothetical protein
LSDAANFVVLLSIDDQEASRLFVHFSRQLHQVGHGPAVGAEKNSLILEASHRFPFLRNRLEQAVFEADVQALLERQCLGSWGSTSRGEGEYENEPKPSSGHNHLNHSNTTSDSSSSFQQMAVAGIPIASRKTWSGAGSILGWQF